MNFTDKITSDFLGGTYSDDGVIPDIGMVNMKRVLKFLANVPKHTSRINKILKLSGHADIDTKKLYAILEDDLQDSNIDNLIAEPLSGSGVTVVKEHTVLWIAYAFYWSYEFNIKTDAEILKKYNHRIGDIFLKFAEYYIRIKQQELETGDEKHDNESFFAFIALGKVRAIEFLVKIKEKDNKYLSKTYLVVNSDLDLNFFYIQNTNKWESEALTTVKIISSGKYVMKYNNEEDGLSFQIESSRMLKNGSVNNFRPAYYKTLQLYNLDGRVANSKYDKMVNSTTKKRKVSSITVKPIMEELDAELIRPKIKITKDISTEERLETEAMQRPKHRDFSFSVKSNLKNIVVDNSYAQHLRNRGFSSKLIINESMLSSDYTIPEFEHLSLFSATAILVDNDTDKLCASIFMLMVVLGTKFTDLIDMLTDKKNAVLSYKDNILTTQIDKDIFANDVNDFLEQHGYSVKFNIPHLMGLIISKLIQLVKTEDKSTEELYNLFEEYLKNAVADFKYKIHLKPKKLYRILKKYTKENSNDLLSGLFATGVYSQSDIAKLAYTAVRTNSAKHSELIANLWIELDFDILARKILGLSGTIFATTRAIEIPQIKFSGSSKHIKSEYSKEFFHTLRMNTSEYDLDSDNAFNLASITIRYSMSLLLGTRNFKNSANFESISFSEGMLMINEKATSISAGLRIIPLCDTINTLLQTYYTNFLQPRGLSKAVWLINDGIPSLFTAKKAFLFLKSLSNLENIEFCQQYVEKVPLNTGRHGFTKYAIEQDISSHYINAYLGHNTAGGEQFGIYSTIDVQSYKEAIKSITTKMAFDHGVKDRLW